MIVSATEATVNRIILTNGVSRLDWELVLFSKHIFPPDIPDLSIDIS